MCEHCTPHTPERTKVLTEAYALCADLSGNAIEYDEALGVDPVLTALATAAEGLCELTAPEDPDPQSAARQLERAALAARAAHTGGRTLGALRASTAEALALAHQDEPVARALTLTYADDQGEHTVHLDTQPSGALQVDATPVDHPQAHAEVEAALATLVRALRHLPAGTWHVDP